MRGKICGCTERFGKTERRGGAPCLQSFREGGYSRAVPRNWRGTGPQGLGQAVSRCWSPHMNTDNLHNHFVINSVPYVDGKNTSSAAVSMPSSGRHPTSCAVKWLVGSGTTKEKEPARYARMREAIDQACEDASTAEDFHRALYRQGYIFGSDPNLQVRDHPGTGWRTSRAAL